MSLASSWRAAINGDRRAWSLSSGVLLAFAYASPGLARVCRSALGFGGCTTLELGAAVARFALISRCPTTGSGGRGLRIALVAFLACHYHSPCRDNRGTIVRNALDPESSREKKNQASDEANERLVWHDVRSERHDHRIAHIRRPTESALDVGFLLDLNFT